MSFIKWEFDSQEERVIGDDMDFVVTRRSTSAGGDFWEVFGVIDPGAPAAGTSKALHVIGSADHAEAGMMMAEGWKLRKSAHYADVDDSSAAREFPDDQLALSLALIAEAPNSVTERGKVTLLREAARRLNVLEMRQAADHLTDLRRRASGA